MTELAVISEDERAGGDEYQRPVLETELSVAVEDSSIAPT
jgi:hypothetical protein